MDAIKFEKMEADYQKKNLNGAMYSWEELTMWLNIHQDKEVSKKNT